MKTEVLRVVCLNCNLRELCLPPGLSTEELAQLDKVVANRRKVPHGEALFKVGDPFKALYAIRTGFFKSSISTEFGKEQVIGFQMAGEIVREHGLMLLLGRMRAEERLTVFLLNIVQRLNARSFSPSELILRMAREEIGSYLGLKLETVSRTFTKLMDANVIEVNNRHVRIIDVTGLKALGNAC